MNLTDANRTIYDAPIEEVQSMQSLALNAIMELDESARIRILSKYARRYGWNEFDIL